MELEPWTSTHPLKDPSNLGPYLCIGKTVAALCPVDAKQKHRSISVLICSTLPDLSTHNHGKSQNLDPDSILSFTEVCRNQGLAIYVFKNISAWHLILADIN